MKPLFQSDRMMFREFVLNDAGKMFELNADPEVLKYTGDEPFASVELARDFLRKYSYGPNGGLGRWAMALKSSGEFIGWCGLKHNEENLTDIGFRLFKTHWGKGLATEAAEATLHYGFVHKKLNQVVGRTASDNIASIRVLEKLQMSFWKSASCPGIPNALYYRINRDQFLGRTRAHLQV